MERAARCLAQAAPGLKLILHLACGAVGDLLPRLLDLPVAGLGLDFTDAYRAPNLEALRGWHGDKLLQAGVANAREVRVERAGELRAALDAVAERVPAARILAAPSTALLYVPRHAAVEKLTALAAAGRPLRRPRGAGGPSRCRSGDWTWRDERR